MATEKDFKVKNGLQVGNGLINATNGDVSLRRGGSTTNRIRITSGNIINDTNTTISGNLEVTGNFNIAGDINQTSVTTLDVTDKTITVANNAGSAANANGAGIIVDTGTNNPQMIYTSATDEWDFNRSIDINGGSGTGVKIHSGGAIVGAKSGGDTQLMYWGGGPVYYGRSSLGGSVSGHEFRIGGVTKLNVDSSGDTVVSGNLKLTANDFLYTSGTNFDIKHTISSQNITFHTTTSGGATSEIVRVTHNKRVGINIQSPDAPLHVEDSPAGTSAYGGLKVVGAGTGAGSSNAVQIADFGRTGAGTDSGAWIGGRTDETTAIFGAKTATGNIAFEVYQSGWKERMRIKNDGKVGIGTSNPLAQLHIENTTSDGIIVRTTTNNEPFIALQRNSGSNGVAVLRGIDGGDLRIDTGATGAAQTTKMTVTSDGKVGINNTDPDQKLSVNGIISADYNQDFYGAWMVGDSASNGYSTVAVGEWYSSGLYMQKKTGQAFSHIYSYAPTYSIAIAAGSGAHGETALASGEGKVGIGTTSPTAKVHVVDNDSDDYIAIFKQTHASNLGTVQIDTPSDSNARPSRLDFARGGVNKWKTGMVYGDTSNGWGLSDATGSGTAVQQTRFLVQPGGNVGIGTITPDSKLTVNTTTTGDGIELQSSEVSIAKLSRAVVDSTVVASLDGVAGRPIHVGGAVNEDVILANGGGNVGIGTTTPQHELVVASTGNTTLGLVGSGYDDAIAIRFGGGDLSSALGNGNSGAAIISQQAVASGQAKGDLRFQINTGDQLDTAMFIDTSGNVGIGETSPDGELHVKGTGGGNGDIYVERTSGAKIHLQAQSANGKIGTSSNHNLGLNTNATTRLTIDTNGNVGIGNTPQTIYSTFDSLQIGPNKSMILGRSENSLFGTTSNAYINSSGSWTYVNNGLAAMTEMINGEHHWFTAASGTANNAITFQRRMSIISSGNVGIGTNQPIAPLHVAGNAVIETGSPDLYFATTSSTHTNWRVAAQEAVTQSFEIASGTTSAGSNAVNDTYTPRFVINNSGNIGIGVNIPSAKLDVRGASGGGTLTHAVFTGTTNRGAEIRTRSDVSGGQHSGCAEFNSADSEGTGGDIALSSNGNIRMFIGGEGRVGIGTTEPTFTAVSGSTNQLGLEIQNGNNDSSAHLKLTGRNNTGTPGQPTSFEIAHRGDALRTTMRHGGSDTIDINSSGHIHLSPGNSSSTQLFIGGQGGYFGGNSSHNMRAAGAQYMFNAGGSSGSYIFEANGQARLTIDNLGVHQIKTNKTSDNYDMYLKSQNGADPGLAIFRDGQAGFGISVRTATVDYADFILAATGSPDYTPNNTGGSGDGVGVMRLYHSGSVSMPYSAAWSSGVGHVFGNTGAHYMIRTSTSTGNESMIISNTVGSGGATGILQYRNGGTVRGDFLVASHTNGIYFNSGSDYRFKENVATITDDYLTKLTSLRPITYTHSADYDDDTSTIHTGFIAHEVAEVFPEFVDGEKDAVWTQEELDARGDPDTINETEGDAKYQTIAYSKKEWNVYIIKALQELKAENEALKARIETLEG